MRALFTADEVLSLPWRKNEPRAHKGGVYLIRDKQTQEILYAGKAANLTIRLAPSVHPVYNCENHDLYILFEQDENERRYLEARCIELLKPSINIRRGMRAEMPKEVIKEYYDRIFG